MPRFRTPGPYLAGAVILASLGISGCNIFNRWDAIVYTNKFDRANSLDIGTYESLEDCREAAKAKIAELKIGELGGYICGENCLVKWGFGNMRMCERTSR